MDSSDEVWSVSNGLQPEVGDRTALPWYRKPAIWVGVGAVIAAAVLVFLLLPRARFVVSDFEVPESVVGGEDVTVRVQLANEGGADGEQELTILIDENPVQTVSVSLKAGAEESVDIVVPALSPGTYELTLADWEGWSGVVWVMTPAEIVVDSVIVSPNPMDINTENEASVVAHVSNNGEADGLHTLLLTLDGETLEERPIELGGGERLEESFTVMIQGPGTSKVGIDDVRASLEVLQLERPGNGTVIVNTVGGGTNRLTISNNSSEDIVVAFDEGFSFTSPRSSELAVYVHANSSYTVKGIRDGNYSMFSTSGSSWCTFRNEFTEGVSYTRFDEFALFTSLGIYYTLIELAFGPGGAEHPTASIGAGDFPQM